MKNELKTSQKIIAIVLAVIMLIGSYTPAKPAHAQVVTDIITELETGLTYVKSALTSVYSSISSYADDSIWIKDYVLDPLAWMEAKGMLQDITNQTVNWVNTGFKGNPAYVTNPTNLFNGIVNQATGAFLSQNGPLSALCSPISLNVRLAIAFNMAGGRGGSGTSGSSGGSNSPYACTLSTVINNVKGASASVSAGASINGFESGDFSQGGWPAFAALAEPQNSFYGAYLQAQSDLDTNIANRTTEQNNQLNRGGGFLSYTTCGPDDPTITDEEAFDDPTIQLDTAASTETNIYQRCQISTPGTTISASLNKALGSSQDSLVQASMLDEIIGDLAGKLVNQVLGSGGLAGVSNTSNGPSYLSQIETQQNTLYSNTAASVAQTTSSDVSRYIGYATQAKNYEDSSLALAETASSTYAGVLQYCSSVGDTNAVNQINSDMIQPIGGNSTYPSGGITPWINKLQSEDATASSTLAVLNNFNQQVSGATSVDAVSNMTQELVAAGGVMPSPTTASDAQTENGEVNILVNGNGQSVNPIAGMIKEANLYQSECQSYASTTPSYASTTPSLP